MTSVWFVVVVIATSAVCLVWSGCSSAKGFICPLTCDCTATKINCSYRDLSHMPIELPSTAEDIQLDNNNITHLNAGDLANCTTLLRLNLSSNSLTFIDEAAFADTVALTSLDLASNELVIGELASNTFKSLKSLQKLWIEDNNWPKDEYYHGKLFSELINLQTLFLDGIPNQTFPREFSQLRNLRTLTVTGGLNEIANETFAMFNSSRITSLDIRPGNSLIAVKPLSFAHFRHLERLYLNENRKLGFENVAKAWFGLQQTKITLLNLDSIAAESDEPQQITSKFFQYLNKTNITVLILSNNNLVHIKPLFSSNLKYLQQINLAGNRLYNPAILMADLAKLENLEVVQASMQSCSSVSLNEHVENSNPFDYDRLGRILKHSPVHPERDVTGCRTYELQECNASHAGPTTAHSVTTSASDRGLSPVCLVLPQKVRILYFNEGLFVYRKSLPPLTITKGGGKLKTLGLGSNGLRNINGPIIFTDAPQNLSVGFTFNQIDCLHPDVFKISYERKVKITQLQLNVNNLGLQLERDTEGSTFQYYPFLEVLLLNYNAIKMLNNNTFRNLTKLQQLTLRGNALQNIDFEFAHMRELRILDLSYNALTFLSEATLGKFQELIQRNNLSLAFIGNPLPCTCETVSFLRWMNHNRRNLDSFEATACFFSGQNVNFSRLADYILVELEYECDKKIAVIVSGVMVGLVLLLATLSAVCYRNRWEIRYAFMKLTQRGQRYQQLFAQTVQYDYDAFVVYDSEDRQWVNEELLLHLERDTAAVGSQEPIGSGQIQVNQGFFTGLRLCVHERDFTPGEDIIANIWNKMEKSRKVILVISNTFATSHYCDYELNLARMQSVEIGRNIIVPVLLDMPDIDRISEYLYWVLRRVTYLEWPQRVEEQSQFWRKLRRIIGDVDDDDDSD